MIRLVLRKMGVVLEIIKSNPCFFHESVPDLTDSEFSACKAENYPRFHILFPDI